MKLKAILTVGLLAGSLAIEALAQSASVDPALKPYAKVSGISGNLNSIGSDTLNNLMTLWAEGFKAAYPNVRIQIEGKGTSTAPPALIEGTAQMGPMSRAMKGTEIDAFEAKFGYKPTEIKVAIDALAVFTHKDNPVREISLDQLDGIFSSSLKSGSKNLTRWSEVGVTGPLANRPISIYGRNSASGTYGFFKDVALQGGDFKATVKEQPGSSSVIQGITSDITGIGYSGIGYKTSGVNALAVSQKPGAEAYAPTAENSLNGNYPLARFLYIYVNVKPGEAPDKLTAEFIKFIVSKDGQEIVVRDGYYPLPGAAAEGEAAKVSN